MNGDDLKRFLWDLGHFNNPANPTGVVESKLDLLTLTSKEVRAAVQSYQEFMAVDFDRLSLRIHGRKGIADGLIWDATEELFAMPRCGEPDYDIQGANIESAVGRGSWPAGCFTEYPQNHAIAVHIVKSGMPSFLKPHWDRVWETVTAAYRDIGMVLVGVDKPTKPGTKLTFQSLRGSTIGLAIVPNRPRCSDDPIWLRLDPSYHPRDVFHQWCRLVAHELCHNMGLSHTRGGIMNPSIVSGPFIETAWRGDPSEPALRRFFGGEPVPPRDHGPDGPGDPDPPKTPSGRLVLRGVLEGFIDGKSVGEIIAIPKPSV